MNRERPMVTVYLLGKKCTVPADLTIMQAMEYAGFRLVRGCGCRSGFCGACAVWYRIGTTGKMQTALACQMKSRSRHARWQDRVLSRRKEELRHQPLAC